MIDYTNGKIYKLVCGNLTYYGSTIQPLYKRLYQHKKCKINLSSKHLFNLSIETDTPVKIYLVEKYPCNDKMELERRERYYIENYECVNKQIPTRTIKEWREANKDYFKDYYQENKDKLIKQNKQYYEANRNNKLEYQKQYDKANKDMIQEKRKQYFKQYYEKNKDKIQEQKKQYREQNKENIRERNKQYYEANKDKIRERNKQYREQNKDKIKG